MSSARPSIRPVQSSYLAIHRHTSSRLHTSVRKAPFPRAHGLRRNQRRFASTTQQVVTEGRSVVTRLKNLFFGTAIGTTLVFGYFYITDTRASIHRWLVPVALRKIYPDPEEAHDAGTATLKALYQYGLHPRERSNSSAKDLEVEVFGHMLSSPIGTSAGIDKHADIPDALLALGPAVVEVGGATPHPQEGNPKPRIFRINSQNAFINRYGLNSEGADDMAMRLRQRVRQYAYDHGFGIHDGAEKRILDGEAGVPPGSLTEGKLMAVQIAKNKFTPDSDIDAIRRDYVYCVDALGKYADIIVVNVSSPNTPGLRDLQKTGPLTHILKGVVEAAAKVDRKQRPAVMVKVSPDEDTDDQVSGICEAIWASGVDGVTVGNTTKRRPEIEPTGRQLTIKEKQHMLEAGGYSGPQLFERTLALVKKYRKVLDRGPENEVDQSTKVPAEKTPTPSVPASKVEGLSDKLNATVQRDGKNLKADDSDSSSQPMLRLPERHASVFETNDSPSQPIALSNSHLDQVPSSGQALPRSSSSSTLGLSFGSSPFSTNPQKVIFATGGITNGEQALKVLNAGADVAMVYTALIYGGAGTISRIKDEMRTEMKGKARK
jgi:dihydroorotate dehydrogenase